MSCMVRYLCGDELTYVDITCASLCVFLVDADEAPAFGATLEMFCCLDSLI